MKKIRTRFAPSPTGYLHIGGLRTALYSYLFARQNKGNFVIRIEDTDQSRKVPGAVKNIIKTLAKVNLDYDEGPLDEINEKGDFGPYFQSKRIAIYKKYAKQLVSQGKAYYSFVKGEQLENIKKELQKTKTPLRKEHLNEDYSQEELNTKIAQGEEYVIRLQMPKKGKCVYQDLVRGRVEIDYATMDDFVILKSDGFPTYNFANVIDDHEMQISYVIRGEEFIPSMPKHLYLYEVLGFEKPFFAHLPLILNPDKSKLSKRQGDVAVEDYLQKGYLPQALINFVALLGWNPGEGSTQEFFSLEELIQYFSFEKINKSGAVFDLNKLNWMNAKYLRERLSLEKFIELISNDLHTHLNKFEIGHQLLKDKNKLKILAQLIRERIERLDQIGNFFEENQWLDEPAKYSQKLLTWRKSTLPDALNKLKELTDFTKTLEKSDFNSPQILENIYKKWIQEHKYGVGDVLWPMRVALTGQERSPSPFEVASIIGKEETIRRLSQAIN